MILNKLHMANTKSAKKEARKTISRTECNKAVPSTLKTFAIKLKGLRLANKTQEATALAAEYISALDKATKKKVVHANKVSHIKGQRAECVFSKAKIEEAKREEVVSSTENEEFLLPSNSKPLDIISKGSFFGGNRVFWIFSFPTITQSY
jgi:small subunit ribosomal protein S20